MTRKIAVIAAVGLFLFGENAWAHRINEYLQATIVSVQANEAHAAMRLIPGVLVAPSVIVAIDSNQDGVFSESEQCKQVSPNHGIIDKNSLIAFSRF